MEASEVIIGDKILRGGHFHPVIGVIDELKRIGPLQAKRRFITITHDRGSVSYEPHVLVEIERKGAR
jgi:hypothetical protein